MKKLTLLFLAICCAFSIFPTNMLTKELNDGWRFRQARLTNWYPATVPGVVHTDLMDNGIIEDPFFRLNERGVQWVDKEDWIYETTFHVGTDILEKRNIRLNFKGLDTYADVYLNDVMMMSADNMFREWIIDIKDFLKEGDNTLRIYFHSPIKIDLPKWHALPYHYEASNDQSENGGLLDRKLSIFTRKAGYHYGWDWGPRLVTSGIWRPILLEAWDDMIIQNVYIRQKEVNTKKAVITHQATVLCDRDIDQAEVIVKDNITNQVYAKVKRGFQRGMTQVDVDFTIKNPKLWWSLGLGDPHLYEFRTEVISTDGVKDENVTTTGLRSIRVIHEADEYGKTFYFELNGVPVFAKGANYIPQDNFLPRVTREDYERTILDAVKANMNMLRIWGGGIYEEDYFYELCNKHGIMVWQDFMFSCSMYPSEGELLYNIRQEAIDNVVRLRNHPCIAIWCGNNEINQAWYGWGWKRQYEQQNPVYATTIWRQYDELFHKTLPEVVAECHSESFYWPSSPFSRKDGTTEPNKGDDHYWGVWHAKEPTSQYNIARSRFFSEYGFQSFPEFESVKRYAPEPKDWDITSEVMMAHQRGGAFANSLIETYLLNEYPQPKDFQSFLYLNQVLQGDAIKTAMEVHRRDMPYCMGSLFWQHNDCWPVASWSSRDYYGRWKAQHYFARKAYEDILVSPIEKDGRVYIYGVSDRLKNAKADMELTVMKLDGTIINQIKQSVNIPANASTVLYEADTEALIKNEGKADVVIVVTLTEKGGKTYSNNYFLLKQKDINFPEATIRTSVKPSTGGYEVTLAADNFARAVFLSIEGTENFFEDNYFDLLPGSSLTVHVKSRASLADFEEQLKVVSISDTQKAQSFHDFTVTDINGKFYDLSRLKGKKVLVVNVASKCGLTPQYDQLQELYEKYKDKNFTIIGFPCNNFGKQEPGTHEEIQEFCRINYGVTFPLMSKIDVKGESKAQVYKWLTEKAGNGKADAEVQWNFQKFMIDEDGNWVDYIPPQESPMSEKIIGWIEGK